MSYAHGAQMRIAYHRVLFQRRRFTSRGRQPPPANGWRVPNFRPVTRDAAPAAPPGGVEELDLLPPARSFRAPRHFRSR